MRSLVTLVKNILTDTFHPGQRSHSYDTRHKRFIMESLETRVLLSSEPAAVAELIELPGSTPDEVIVLLIPHSEDSSDAAEVETDFEVDTLNGSEEHDAEEGEEE